MEGEGVMGAPRKNSPSNAALDIERLAAQGHSIIGIAKHFRVSRETFKRWCEEDDVLQEAFEVGRDSHRQYLVSLIAEAAKANKGANSNAMFLLKTMHGFREFDSSNTKVDVTVTAPTNVMVVKDYGDDAAWEARTRRQQAALVAMAGDEHLQLEAPQAAPVVLQPSSAVPEYLSTPKVETTPLVPSYGPPAWTHRT
jgi:hypothetical protein